MQKSLPLTILFKIKDREIEEITAHISSKSKLDWQIIADKPTPALEKQIDTWMSSYSLGKHPKGHLPLRLDHLPAFTQRVLRMLLTIPFGESFSYKEIAERLGHPQAARAVGGACGRNPYLLAIPCHRVLAHNKKLGGFSSGIEVKKALLKFEGQL